MPKDFIVAIELGSSKMTGIAGKKNLDGSIQVLACIKEDSSSCIRKGVVYNIDKTAQCLTNIINKMEGQLKTTITQVYVGVGGQSIRSIRNVISKDMDIETPISQDMVIELMDANRNMKYPDQEILDAAVQEYKVDSQYQLDPVGIPCSHIEGNFLNILQRKTFRQRTDGDGTTFGMCTGRHGCRHDHRQCLLKECPAPSGSHSLGFQQHHQGHRFSPDGGG